MSWDDEAATWNDNPAVQAYSKAAHGALTELVALDGIRALDIGCGTGLLTRTMAAQGAEVVAVDISAAMIAELRDRTEASNVHAVAGDIAELVETGAVAGPFDLITCSSVCAFLPDYPGTVALLASLLAPGGRFVQWDWELNPDDEEPYGLSRPQITAALEGAGLTDISVDVGFEIPFEEMVMAPLCGTGLRPE